MLFCCYYFKNILIGVSSFWRVLPRSCLLNLQDTNLETNSLILPSSPTCTLTTGSLSPSPPSRHSFQWWPRTSQLDEELTTDRGMFSYPSETPQCSGRIRLVTNTLEKSTGTSSLTISMISLIHGVFIFQHLKSKSYKTFRCIIKKIWNLGFLSAVSEHTILKQHYFGYN